MAKFCIFKYPLQLVPVQTLELPGFADVLHIGETSGGLFVWCLVDNADETKQVFTFRIFATGQALGLVSECMHRATIIDKDEFVWHVYQDLNPETYPPIH